ncbi:hypothetical protein IE81DRAFT_77829 [Ceraceosorus guamensis]|uniref:Uncharacterized protein n=1 Tax=Ceraceosorus guamensis TaxID=1522189 RepID=A0A316W7C6_9BASI|nr:hypothetical protein IE81DRAFT_77829 [Ceraceosorus guamensis]PWN43545.1 hypothetical protein IE81DRAFT_77829 [Ceraceosorus guamensis]
MSVRAERGWTLKRTSITYFEARRRKLLLCMPTYGSTPKETPQCAEPLEQWAISEYGAPCDCQQARELDVVKCSPRLHTHEVCIAAPHLLGTCHGWGSDMQLAEQRSMSALTTTTTRRDCCMAGRRAADRRDLCFEPCHRWLCPGRAATKQEESSLQWAIHGLQQQSNVNVAQSSGQVVDARNFKKSNESHEWPHRQSPCKVWCR